MAAVSNTFWGVGPHYVYHSLGHEVIAAAYDLGTGEQIEGAIIKNWYGSIEISLPANHNNGCRVVVVG